MRSGGTVDEICNLEALFVNSTTPCADVDNANATIQRITPPSSYVLPRVYRLGIASNFARQFMLCPLPLSSCGALRVP